MEAVLPTKLRERQPWSTCGNVLVSDNLISTTVRWNRADQPLCYRSKER